MTDQRVEALQSVPLFEKFSNRELRRVMEIAKDVTHPDGKAIVEEDHSAAGFHLILAGTAEASASGVVIATMGPGDYFGEMSLIDGKPRSATVTARGELHTLAIPAWNFNRLLDDHPPMMRALLVQLSERIRKHSAAQG